MLSRYRQLTCGLPANYLVALQSYQRSRFVSLSTTSGFLRATICGRVCSVCVFTVGERWQTKRRITNLTNYKKIGREKAARAARAKGKIGRDVSTRRVRAAVHVRKCESCKLSAVIGLNLFARKFVRSKFENVFFYLTVRLFFKTFRKNKKSCPYC